MADPRDDLQAVLARADELEARSQRLLAEARGSATAREISRVDEPCSATADEIVLAMSPISPIVVAMPPMAWTASPETDCISLIWAAISSVALAVWLARLLTSDATTAKPLPASPARAASIVALRARRLVCSAISLIRLTISPILSAALARPWTVWFVRSAS